MIFKKRLLFTLLLFLLSLGCTTKEGNKSWYDTIQNHNKFNCRKIIIESQYKHCISQTKQNYHDYERDRKEINK